MAKSAPSLEQTDSTPTYGLCLRPLNNHNWYSRHLRCMPSICRLPTKCEVSFKFTGRKSVPQFERFLSSQLYRRNQPQ